MVNSCCFVLFLFLFYITLFNFFFVFWWGGGVTSPYLAFWDRNDTVNNTWASMSLWSYSALYRTVHTYSNWTGNSCLLQLLPQEAFKNKEVNRTIKRQRGYTESVDVSIVTVLASIMSCKLWSCSIVTYWRILILVDLFRICLLSRVEICSLQRGFRYIEVLSHTFYSNFGRAEEYRSIYRGR